MDAVCRSNGELRDAGHGGSAQSNRELRDAGHVGSAQSRDVGLETVHNRELRMQGMGAVHKVIEN